MLALAFQLTVRSLRVLLVSAECDCRPDSSARPTSERLGERLSSIHRMGAKELTWNRRWPSSVGVPTWLLGTVGVFQGFAADDYCMAGRRAVCLSGSEDLVRDTDGMTS